MGMRYPQPYPPAYPGAYRRAPDAPGDQKGSLSTMRTLRSDLEQLAQVLLLAS
jgi:hypothetical protein